MKKSVVLPWTLGFLIMGALMGLLLVLSLYFVSRLYLDYLQITGVHTPRQLAAVSLQANLLAERWAMDAYLQAGDPADRARAEAARAQADADLDVLVQALPSNERYALAARYQDYRALIRELLGANGSASPPLRFPDRADDALAELLQAAALLHDDLARETQDALARYHASFRRRLQVILGLGLWLLLAGPATGLTLGRSFTRPLARLAEAAQRLGEGDLTAASSEWRAENVPARNEIGALAASFDQMAGSLRLAIERMRATAGALTSSADRLSASASSLQDMTRVTLRQMEQIAEGAAAQSQGMRAAAQGAQGIAAALEHSAEQAQEAGRSASNAQTRLEDTARTIAVLDHEAVEIQNITAVIEQFARETHMLSFNAAIEARRAGEAGRGFAAVSDEMRALAERSARSAGEVARFGARVQAEIESVGQAVGEVQAAVEQTARFARQTVDAARRQERETASLAQTVQEAAQVSDDQARIAAHVSTAVADQADAIAELATAAQGLTRLVQQLESLTARFVTRTPSSHPHKEN